MALAAATALAAVPAAGQVADAARPSLPAPDTVMVPDLRVEVTRAPPGKMRGFHRRRDRGVGTFITREEIEERNPARLSDLFYQMAGVRPVALRDGSGRRRLAVGRSEAVRRRRGCPVRFWVDGAPIPPATGFRLDELSVEDVAGIELYRGPAQVPPRFSDAGSLCGVVVVWTRDPAEAAARSP